MTANLASKNKGKGKFSSEGKDESKGNSTMNITTPSEPITRPNIDNEGDMNITTPNLVPPLLRLVAKAQARPLKLRRTLDVAPNGQVREIIEERN